METEELSFVITLRKWVRYSMIGRIIILGTNNIHPQHGLARFCALPPPDFYCLFLKWIL